VLGFRVPGVTSGKFILAIVLLDAFLHGQGQERLFYNFRLEDQVPANHLLRKLDALLDFDMVRKQLEPFYSEIGRPSVDPELMIRMLLIGYCYSIRSERRLCGEVRFNRAMAVSDEGIVLSVSRNRSSARRSPGRPPPRGCRSFRSERGT
jgi:Transposase domain (DUF772)